jgi:hypothetical protein
MSCNRSADPGTKIYVVLHEAGREAEKLGILEKAQRQASFIRWSAIWVGFYPLGRQFCPLGAVFNGQRQLAAFFVLSTFFGTFG